MKNFFQKHKQEIIIVFSIFILFLALRLPGIHLPYHQDEYKTAISVEQGEQASGSMFAHPPLTQIIYRISYSIVGGSYLRLYPIFFSSLSLFLLYYLLRKKEGKHTALVGISLFTLCFYSVWSSLMLDTDGAIIPFFFLVSLCAYDTFVATLPDFHKKKRNTYVWLTILIISLIVGFLVKLSFILVVGAILVDFIWKNGNKFSKKQLIYAGIALVSLGASVIVLMFLIHVAYPAFSVGNMLQHAKSFVHLGGRDYIQVIVQAIKAVFYLSPLLIFPLFFTTKEKFSHARIYYVYLVLGFIFYFILFDFSRGALDKYLMFLTIPLIMIIAPVFSTLWTDIQEKKNRKFLVVGGVIGIILILLNFLPHAILPLYPKTFWFSQALHLHWAFLNPFMGGSGPLGFYMSFLFIVISFILSFLCVVLAFFKKEWRKGCLIVIVLIGVVYNGVFAEELLFGKLYGSSGKVLRETLDYIQSSQSIKSVITYNDSGSYELTKMGKYAARFYTAPMFESTHKPMFEKHNGYFLVVNIPKINSDSFYSKFFAQCDTVYSALSGRITSNIYDCKK